MTFGSRLITLPKLATHPPTHILSLSRSFIVLLLVETIDLWLKPKLNISVNKNGVPASNHKSLNYLISQRKSFYLTSWSGKNKLKL